MNSIPNFRLMFHHTGASGRFLIECVSVHADGLAVDDPPLPADHHPIGFLRTAEDERGNRVVGSGECEAVETEHRKVGLLADLDGADIITTECRRRSLRRPVEDAVAGDRLGAVAQTLDVEGLADLADEVRGIVRRGSVDAEPDIDSGVL